MKAKLVDGKVTIDLSDLIDAFSPADQADVGRHLVADKDLFSAVLECVVDGHYNQDDPRGPWWFGSEAVLELREKLLPLMPQVAREALREALRQRDAAKAEAERHRSWAYKLYHAWPDSHWRDRPRGPDDWKPTALPSDAAVDAFVASQLPGTAEEPKR